MGVVVLEQRAGRPRADAWKHLADRTGVDSVRNLVSMLVQSEQFGTSIAQDFAHPFRHPADPARTAGGRSRRQRPTIKLVFPLVFFIFPSLFLVILGPAIIQMAAAFKEMGR